MTAGRYRVGVLTVSDRAARGEYEDLSGPSVVAGLGADARWAVVAQAIVADEVAAITAVLTRWSDDGLHLILTTGGTGFAPRDVTPEATQAILDRPAPGIAEALRAESLKITRHAMLSRGVAGIRQTTLIINLPGNPKAVTEQLAIALPVLPHALDLLREAPAAADQHRDV